MSTEDNLDLSAYPVLRLDEVPRHSEETLRRGQTDGRELLLSLQSESLDENRSMIRYLAKQLDAMSVELAKRNAQSRIQQMLLGEVTSSTADYASLPPSSARRSLRGETPCAEAAHPSSAPSAIPSTEKPPRPEPQLYQVPLPSQVNNSVVIPPPSDSTEADSFPVRRKRGSLVAHKSGTPLTASLSEAVLDRTIDGVQTRLTNGVNPSKQSLIAMNNAFGVSFVVGAIERKKRYIPKKVVVDPEEELGKARQNRRRMAMQRLLERQNARKTLHEKLRRRKLLKQTKQQAAVAKATNSDVDDQSEIESISGGDDDDESQGLQDSSPDCPHDMSETTPTSRGEVSFKDKILVVNEISVVENKLIGFDDSELITSKTNIQCTTSHDDSSDVVDATQDAVVSVSSHHTRPLSSEEVSFAIADATSTLFAADSNESTSSNVPHEIRGEVPALLEAWTDNPVLLEKNRNAWLTIQRLRSSRSMKMMESVNEAEQQPESPKTHVRDEISSDSCALTSRADSPRLSNPAAVKSETTGVRDVSSGHSSESKAPNYPLVWPVSEFATKETDNTVATVLHHMTLVPGASETNSDEEGVGWKVESPPEDTTAATFPSEKVTSRLIESPTLSEDPKDMDKSISSSLKSKGQIITCPYDSFDMIFCAAYGPDGGSRFVRKGEALAASDIYQSMRAICKLYEEWMEVMEDYATVFSSDNTQRMPTVVQPDDPSHSVYKGGSKALHYRVKSSRVEVCNLIADVFGQSLTDWEELPSGLGLGLSWNFLWSWGRPRLNFDHLLVWQKVNHFTDSGQLTRKDKLKRNIQSLTEMGKGKKSGEFFEIMPLTFLLPADYNAFVKTFHEIESSKAEMGTHNIWIMKPIGMSRGRGISMVTDANTLTYSQASVLQRYVDRPMCLDGYKFDLRLYILVTSFCPLEAFIYKEGFARLSTHKYSMDSKEIHNKFVHLTNSSIQKQNNEGPSKDNPLLVGPPSDAGGSKISLLGEHGLWRRLEKCGHDVAAMWDNICALVVKSLVAVDDKMTFQPSCFEVYGYDVLIDEDLRPWLIEVNASPAMARDNYVDVRVKNALIKDTVKLLDPAPFDRSALLKVIKRRLRQVSSNLHQPAPSKNDSNLSSDIAAILGDHRPRKYGEEPAYFGDYQRLCPNTKTFQQAMKFKGKIFNRSPIN